MDEAFSAATEYEEVESLIVCWSAVHGRKRSGDGITTIREPATWKEVELRLVALASSRRIAGRLTGGGAFSAGEDVAVV